MKDRMKRSGIIYLPVISGGASWMPSTKTERKYNGHHLGWWMDNPIHPYDAVLMSAYYGLDTVPDRSSLKMRDDVIFFGDSGGFQILNLGWSDPVRREQVKAHLSPAKIIEWQQHVCDVGMTLDIPLPDFHIYSRAEFEDHLSQSKANGDLMRSLHTNKNFSLFSVVHGRNLPDLTEWFKVTTKDYDFDGYSLDAGNVRTVAMDLGFAMEHLTNIPFHILGASGFQSLNVMAWANQYMKTTLYLDSSTYNMGNQLRKYMNPFDLPSKGLMMGVKDPKDQNVRSITQLDTIFCPCPICSQLTTPEELWSLGTLSGQILSLHNLYWMDAYVKYLESLQRSNITEFREFIWKISPDHIRRYLTFIDDVNDKGLDKAWNYHFERSTTNIQEWY